MSFPGCVLQFSRNSLDDETEEDSLTSFGEVHLLMSRYFDVRKKNFKSTTIDLSTFNLVRRVRLKGTAPSILKKKSQ